MKYKKTILILGFLTALFVLLQWPTTTRQGVNWEVSELKIPLYLKTLSFVSRHYEMKYAVKQILQNETDENILGYEQYKIKFKALLAKKDLDLAGDEKIDIKKPRTQIIVTPVGLFLFCSS